MKKVSITHLFLSVLISTLLCLPSKAATIDQEPQLYSAYQDVLKLKLESGRAKLSRIIPNAAQLGHYHFISSLADALEVIVTEDEELYKKLQSSEEDHLRGIRDMEENDPHKRFYASEIRIHWAIAKILFEDELRAGWSLKTAYSDIERNIEEFPDFAPNFKSYGSMHVLFAVVPESYHWLLKFFGVRANSIDGWQELNRINANSPYWVETGMIKALIAMNILNREDQTLEILDDLITRQKDNLIINYFYHSALIKYSRSEQSLEGLKKLIFAGKSYYPIHHIHYKIGEIYLQKQSYSMARFYYAKFLNLHKGTNYVKDTWFKIFLTFYLENNDKMAEIHWTKATKSGRAIIAADRNAQDLLEQDMYPNKSLIRARLATDGGYFLLATQSLNDIKQGSLTNKKEETEYFYRFARLYHKEEKIDDAMFYYLNTIKKAGKENWYFAPSSSLYIGYLYEANEDYEKARYFYEKALSYKKHKYKAGIDNKALAALELLKEKYPEQAK